MDQRITLYDFEAKLLKDICEYINFDDKEKEDFINEHGEVCFNEHGVLEVFKIPRKAESHIYYKVEYFRQQLANLLK